MRGHMLPVMLRRGVAAIADDDFVDVLPFRGKRPRWTLTFPAAVSFVRGMCWPAFRSTDWLLLSVSIANATAPHNNTE